MYTFRCDTSDKQIHLTQQELDCIPYLTAFVAHKDDFLSIENENGEYVLNPPIDYNWFMPILHSINSNQPYLLFNELSVDENILDTLQLFDYLGINSFAFPLLEEKHLIELTPINNDNEERRVEYHRATLEEARNTAAEFVIALTKNEYDLHNSYTILRIFSLIMIIFSYPPVFSSRFRHHTLTIVKEYCLTFFSKTQQRQLPNAKQIDQNSKMDPWIYISSDNDPLPEYFNNVFAWNGIYKLIKKPNRNHLFNHYGMGRPRLSIFACISSLCELLNERDFKLPIYHDSVSSFHLSKNEYNYYYLLNVTPTRTSSIIINYNDKKLYNNQVQSRRFNNLPKRPNIDKIKHRTPTKTRKYR